MSRHGFHAFTSDAPVFGAEVDCIDPFYGQPGCRVCGRPILTAELCPECAKGNDPFVQSKFSSGRNH